MNNEQGKPERKEETAVAFVKYIVSNGYKRYDGGPGEFWAKDEEDGKYILESLYRKFIDEHPVPSPSGSEGKMIYYHTTGEIGGHKCSWLTEQDHGKAFTYEEFIKSAERNMAKTYNSQKQSTGSEGVPATKKKTWESMNDKFKELYPIPPEEFGKDLIGILSMMLGYKESDENYIMVRMGVNTLRRYMLNVYQIDIAGASSQKGAVDILRELVALKDIKEFCERAGATDENFNKWQDYLKRKPVAWENAKKFLNNL